MANRRKKRRVSASQKKHPSDTSYQIMKALELPTDILPHMFSLRMSGNREAVVEGSQGVLEYHDNSLKIAAGDMAVRFIGLRLQIKNMAPDRIIVEGEFTSVEFSSL